MNYIVLRQSHVVSLDPLVTADAYPFLSFLLARLLCLVGGRRSGHSSGLGLLEEQHVLVVAKFGEGELAMPVSQASRSRDCVLREGRIEGYKVHFDRRLQRIQST